MLVVVVAALTAWTSGKAASSTTLASSAVSTSQATSTATTTFTPVPTLTLREPEVREYTLFTATTDCDPMTEDRGRTLKAARSEEE